MVIYSYVTKIQHKYTVTILFIHFLHCLSYWVAENLEPNPEDSGHREIHPEQDVSLAQGTVTHKLTHTYIHYTQFRGADQPTTEVWEDTRVPEDNHANSTDMWWMWEANPNRRGVRQMC